MCTVRAEYNGRPSNATIEWIRIDASETTLYTEALYIQNDSLSNISGSAGSGSGSGSGSGAYDHTSSDFNVASAHQTTVTEAGYQSVLTTTENDTVTSVIYRCKATAQNDSTFSDATVKVQVIAGMQIQLAIHVAITLLSF